LPDTLKYATVERERRYLVLAIPDGVTNVFAINDRYVIGTRLRLRQVVETDGTIVRKLGHKVRIGESPAEIANTSLSLNDAEWDILSALPARTLHGIEVGRRPLSPISDDPVTPPRQLGSKTPFVDRCVIFTNGERQVRLRVSSRRPAHPITQESHDPTSPLRRSASRPRASRDHGSPARRRIPA
jgi:hypothetical protein